MRSIAEAAGLKVHVYTSPHLVTFNERIRIAGDLISDDALESLLDECEAANGDDPITFFEITTALAFLAFARTPADLCLLETGLGGRLDATNVLAAPAVNALTPISIDHVGFLGEDIRGIAAEKAAIMRQDVPAVVSAQVADVDQVIREAAENIGSRLLSQDEDWRVGSKEDKIHIQTTDHSVTVAVLGLIGDHQIQNAAQAVTCLSAWRPDLVTHENVETGLRSVHWPGRLQRLTSGPLVDLLPNDWELWLDGGHNPAAGGVLAAQGTHWSDKPLHAVMGLISTKDPGDFVAPLAAHLHSLQAVGIEGEDASIEADELAAIARRSHADAQAAPSLTTAVENILKHAAAPGRILICGSLYLAGQVLREND